MHIVVDRTRCIGAGNCVLAAPNVFTQDDEDGLVVVLNQNPQGEDAEGSMEAEKLCPARVIALQK